MQVRAQFFTLYIQSCVRALVARPLLFHYSRVSTAFCFVCLVFHFFFQFTRLLFHACVRSKFEKSNNSNIHSPHMCRMPKVQERIVRLGRGFSGRVLLDARPPGAFAHHFSRLLNAFQFRVVLCVFLPAARLATEHPGSRQAR